MRPAFVRCLSGVSPTYVRRTVKVGRNAGPSVIARDVMTYNSDDVVTEVKKLVFLPLQLQY